MKIAAISDLHIGAYARSDSFGHAQDAFLRLLDGLEATHDLIVLLVKLVIAAIPAAFIVFVLFAAGSAVLGGLFKGIGV